MKPVPEKKQVSVILAFGQASFTKMIGMDAPPKSGDVLSLDDARWTVISVTKDRNKKNSFKARVIRKKTDPFPATIRALVGTPFDVPVKVFVDPGDQALRLVPSGQDFQDGMPVKSAIVTTSLALGEIRVVALHQPDEGEIIAFGNGPATGMSGVFSTPEAVVRFVKDCVNQAVSREWPDFNRMHEEILFVAGLAPVLNAAIHIASSVGHLAPGFSVSVGLPKVPTLPDHSVVGIIRRSCKGPLSFLVEMAIESAPRLISVDSPPTSAGAGDAFHIVFRIGNTLTTETRCGKNAVQKANAVARIFEHVCMASFPERKPETILP